MPHHGSDLTRAWLVVIWVGLATMVIKGLGPIVFGGKSLPTVLRPAAVRLAPALFGGLIATQTFSNDRSLSMDARAAGLAAAIIGAAVGAPPVVILTMAVAATATIRRAER
jgi:hypothetical protein